MPVTFPGYRGWPLEGRGGRRETADCAFWRIHMDSDETCAGESAYGEKIATDLPAAGGSEGALLPYGVHPLKRSPSSHHRLTQPLLGSPSES